MVAAPDWICWAPRAMARRPEPHTWLMPQAGLSTGMPAAIDAWRAGFWPWPAVSTWPRMTSETSPGCTPARSIAALMAIFPSSWPDRLDSEPLNEPTGVRAALAMTMVLSSLIGGRLLKRVLF